MPLQDDSLAPWYVRDKISAWHLEPNSELEDIVAAIEESKSILDLQDNWDGEGSVGYTKGTWERATEFVQDLVECADNLGYTAIGVPRVLPADEGSIDVFWRDSTRDLLINFSADPTVPPSAFGRNNDETLEGVYGIDFQKDQLIAWLSRKN